jgi:hypothetical protein
MIAQFPNRSLMPVCLGLLAFLGATVEADFHILGNICDSVTGASSSQTWSQNVACPSDQYNCNCFVDGYAGTFDFSGGPGDSFFWMEGICGGPSSGFNFYQTSSGYDFYINGGDGTLQGQCYNNLGTTSWCETFGGSCDSSELIWCSTYWCV